MNDEELFYWLGFDRDGIDPVKAKAYVAALTPEKRELFERMKKVELWVNGLGPPPDFPVLVCR